MTEEVLVLLWKFLVWIRGFDAELLDQFEGLGGLFDSDAETGH